MSEPKWITDKDLSQRYGVSRITIWRWVKSGLIPGPRKIAPNTTRWNVAELDAHDARLLKDS